MSSNLLDSQIKDILQTVLEDDQDEVLIVNPSGETIEELIDVVNEIDEADRATVNVLANEGVLKAVMGDFIVASNAADLIDADVLSLRTLGDEPENSLLVTPGIVIALVSIDDAVAGLTTDDDSFVETAYETYRSRWSDAEAYKLRTPPLSRVRNTLRTDIGDAAEADFDAVLGSLQTARGDGDGLDEVTISLLVAAKNDALLYDISKWGEDVGIASKATFSRTKTRLEDMGIIDTEKVPIDVGRPRLRLKLGDERLRGASSDELANVAMSILN